MEKEWDPVNFDILPYKETGTYIVKTSEETSQLLDDHIVMTQSMSFSPYKKPFEDRISNWESKLRTTQVLNQPCVYVATGIVNSTVVCMSLTPSCECCNHNFRQMQILFLIEGTKNIGVSWSDFKASLTFSFG